MNDRNGLTSGEARWLDEDEFRSLVADCVRMADGLDYEEIKRKASGLDDAVANWHTASDMMAKAAVWHDQDKSDIAFWRSKANGKAAAAPAKRFHHGKK
jgi:hypothetical protein